MIDSGLVQSGEDPDNNSSNILASVSFHLLTRNHFFLHFDSVCHHCEQHQLEISLSEIPQGYAKMRKDLQWGKPVWKGYMLSNSNSLTLGERHNGRDSKGLVVAKGSRKWGESRAAKLFGMIHNWIYFIIICQVPIECNTDMNSNVDYGLWVTVMSAVQICYSDGRQLCVCRAEVCVTNLLSSFQFCCGAGATLQSQTHGDFLLLCPVVYFWRKVMPVWLAFWISVHKPDWGGSAVSFLLLPLGQVVSAHLLDLTPSFQHFLP